MGDKKDIRDVRKILRQSENAVLWRLLGNLTWNNVLKYRPVEQKPNCFVPLNYRVLIDVTRRFSRGVRSFVVPTREMDFKPQPPRRRVLPAYSALDADIKGPALNSTGFARSGPFAGPWRPDERGGGGGGGDGQLTTRPRLSNRMLFLGCHSNVTVRPHTLLPFFSPAAALIRLSAAAASNRILTMQSGGD